MPAARAASPVRRDLRYSALDGAGWSVMVGMGELYVPAFALAAGQGEVAAGLVATVPLLLGAILQCAGPALAERVGSLRRWVVILSAVQAAAFLPLALGAGTGGMGTLALFAVMTLYWGTGIATGPPWVTWIETLVPRRVRARYFGVRGILTNGALLGAILAGGAVLAAAKARGATLAGFALLFVLAGLGRAASTRWLALHRETWKPAMRRVGPGEILAGLRRTPGGRLVAAMVAMQAAIFVALPFFNPWVLEELGLPYGRYTALLAAGFLARMAFLPFLARAAERRGPRALLLAAGAGFVPVSALWILLDGFWPLLLVQVLAGAVFAAWELATLMLFFETMPREERMGVLTWFNLANAAAIVAGSLAGGAILGGGWGGGGSYPAVFLVSTVLRLLCLPLLLRVREVPRPFRGAGEAALAQSGEAGGAGPAG
ncbi:MAG: MFS transporter [Planctomycetes bacterium]|nr:MFS transporter [Planctomycetota bacterium]